MTSVCLASSLGCTVVKSQMVKMVEVEMVKMVSVEMIRVEMVKMVKVRMVMMVKVKRVNIVRLEMVKMVSVEMVKVEIINMVKLQMFKMLNMKMVKMIKVEMVDMVKMVNMVKLVKVEGSVVSAGKGMPIPVVKLGTLAVRVVLGVSLFLAEAASATCWPCPTTTPSRQTSSGASDCQGSRALQSSQLPHTGEAMQRASRR